MLCKTELSPAVRQRRSTAIFHFKGYDRPRRPAIRSRTAQPSHGLRRSAALEWAASGSGCRARAPSALTLCSRDVRVKRKRPAKIGGMGPAVFFVKLLSDPHLRSEVARLPSVEQLVSLQLLQCMCRGVIHKNVDRPERLFCPRHQRGPATIGLPRSAGMTMMWPPSSSTTRAVSCRPSGERAVMATFAPSAARRTATARRFPPAGAGDKGDPALAVTTHVASFPTDSAIGRHHVEHSD